MTCEGSVAGVTVDSHASRPSLAECGARGAVGAVPNFPGPYSKYVARRYAATRRASRRSFGTARTPNVDPDAVLYDKLLERRKAAARRVSRAPKVMIAHRGSAVRGGTTFAFARDPMS
jgi:hypothetical protein